MAATNSYIQVAPDSTGKKMQTYLATIGADDVHAEAVRLVDGDCAPLGTTAGALNVYLPNLNTTISSTVNVQSTNASNFLAIISGTVTAIQSNASNFLATVSQGGTWNVGTLASITNPVTVAQSNASNLAATVSGTVTVNAGTNLNTSLLATSAKQTDGTQKTQICDPINVSNIAGITAGALNVYLPSITANSGTNLNTANVSIKMVTGSPNLLNGQVAATNVAATLVAARTLRRSVTIRNLDITNSGYIGIAVVATSNGMLVGPRESISTDFTGLIQVIMSSGTANFAYLETYD